MKTIDNHIKVIQKDYKIRADEKQKIADIRHGLLNELKELEHREYLLDKEMLALDSVAETLSMTYELNELDVIND